MRLAPINLAVGTLLDFSGSNDGVASGNRFTPGTILEAAPTDGIDTGAGVPNWGQCELMYVRSNAAGTFALGRLVTIDKDFNIADLANTANLGRPVAVVLTAFAAGNVTPQFGWVMVAGIAPVQYAVAATAGQLFIGGAGQATPTAAAGKQLLNAQCLIAAATTFARNITTQNGSKVVKVGRSNGMFVGLTISGTGIPGATTIAAIDPSGVAITLSAAATATGTVAGTFTPTNYGIVHFNRMFAQGQIT